jgi:hypothetical protein
MTRDLGVLLTKIAANQQDLTSATLGRDIWL